MAKDKNVKIIYKKKYIEGDHDEHIDERWLVSYADMMTLLFGLFVMLYAMQDPEATKKMQESIQQKFTQDQVKDPEQPEVPPPDYQAQIAELTAKLEAQAKTAVEAEQLKAKFVVMEEEAKKLKDDLAKQVTENTKAIEELKRLETENQEKTRSIASIKTETKTSEDLTKEKLIAEEKLKNNETELIKKKNEVKEKDDEIAKMKEQLAQKIAMIDKIDKDKEKPKEKNFEKEYLSESEKTKVLDQKNKELEAKLQTLEQKGSFLAIVLNWFTNEHDLDLVIKDPNGKKFTFKSKEFPNYPGKIVLDSRRGPGAEIWQADKVIPGTYEAEITFYNQYGNAAPAEGKLVIFSTRGNIEIPDIKLDLVKNPKRKVLFEISQLGEIKLK